MKEKTIVENLTRLPFKGFKSKFFSSSDIIDTGKLCLRKYDTNKIIQF